LEQRRIVWLGPIERGVEIPRSRRGENLLRPRMRQLKVGESFATSYTQVAVRRMAMRIGIVCTTRNIGNGQIRVWRTA
jgi:hypothetical protein